MAPMLAEPCTLPGLPAPPALPARLAAGALAAASDAARFSPAGPAAAAAAAPPPMLLLLLAAAPRAPGGAEAAGPAAGRGLKKSMTVLGAVNALRRALGSTVVGASEEGEGQNVRHFERGSAAQKCNTLPSCVFTRLAKHGQTNDELPPT